MPQLYIFVASILAALAIGAAGAWQVQDWRWTANVQAEEIERAKVAAAAERENRRLETKRQSNVMEAQNAATKREAALRSALAAATRTGDGMRDTLYSFRAKLPSATPDACRSDAAALAELLEQVERAGRGMAEAADRHASDSLMYQEAWPK